MRFTTCQRYVVLQCAFNDVSWIVIYSNAVERIELTVTSLLESNTSVSIHVSSLYYTVWDLHFTRMHGDHDHALRAGLYTPFTLPCFGNFAGNAELGNSTQCYEPLRVLMLNRAFTTWPTPLCLVPAAARISLHYSGWLHQYYNPILVGKAVLCRA